MNNLTNEFFNNLFYNDKFNTYIKLYSNKIISLNDAKYKEFHKFIELIKESNISVDDYENIYNEPEQYETLFIISS